tara:strand:- start:407 stop:1543 length:1137 start_codon:yes stop_codon:yes gene_type:complete
MKKKILFLVNDLSFFISHRLQIAESVIALGYSVFVGYGELGSCKISFLKNRNIEAMYIPIDRAGMNPFKEIGSLFLILRLFLKIKPDIVHLVTIKPYLYGGIIARIAGVKCVVSSVSGLGTLFIEEKFNIKLLRTLLYPIYKYAFNHPNQMVIFQNKDDLNKFTNKKILKSSKSIIINGSGVELQNFSNFEEPLGTPIVCFAARLIKDKGVFEYIAAARLIKKRGIEAKFLLAGDLDTKNPTGLNLKELQQIKNEELIEVLGYQNEISVLYANSNIICLPSYREGLPKSLIEAAAASRAVVTTDVPGCRDAIIPNKTGILVPVKDVDKLAEAIIWLIQNPSKRVKMGKAGRQLAEEKFQIKKVIENHLSIYSDLLEKC